MGRRSPAPRPPMTPFDPTIPDAPWGQRWTLAGIAVVEGVGVHTGTTVRLEIAPAPSGHGYAFVRTDLPGTPRIPARPERVRSGYLATVIEADGASVSTVEHVLAALWGLGVTDAELRLDGPEAPIADGSAAPFVEAIRAAGVVALAAPRPFLDLPAAGVGEKDRSVTVVPGPGTDVTVACDYGRAPAGPMLFSTALSPAAFAAEIAPARTFALAEEVAAIRAAGLARGASLDCAVVVERDGYSVPLRFPDELVRHKALDLVGDLALLGAWWRGRVVAVKAGHALHVSLARRIAAERPGQARPESEGTSV